MLTQHGDRQTSETLPAGRILSSRGHSLLRELLFAVVTFLAYLLLAKAGSALQYTEFRSTPWNPAAAVSVCAGLRFRWWSVPVIFIANLLDNFISPPHFGIGILVPLALAHVTAFTIAPALLVRSESKVLSVSVRKVFIALVACGVLAVLAAAARMLTLALAFNIPIGATLLTSQGQAVGNVVGILTVVPTYMAFRKQTSLWSSWAWGDGINILAVLGAVFVVFGLESTDEFKFFYLLFLPVVVFALRRGFAGAAFSILVTNLAMLALLVLRSFDPPVISELQILMISLSFTGLLLSAAVTEQQRAELNLKESQAALLRSSRISLAGEMASALSHELNQPLSAARSYTRSALRQLQSRKNARQQTLQDLESAVHAVDEMAKTIKSVRQFIKRDEGNFETISVADWARETIKLVMPDFNKSKISIDDQLSSEIFQMHGNYVQLQQVLVNLLRNAREGIKPGNVKSRISVSASDRNRPGYIEISVSDNGTGIPEGMREKLFSPLVSDKPDGLGLGLSLCQSIIRNHGGEIWLAKSSQDGSKFTFTVPLKRVLNDEEDEHTNR